MRIHLLSHAHNYSLHGGKFYVCACGLCPLYYNKDFVKSRFVNKIEVLFHTFYCNFGRPKENRSFIYRGLRYIEVQSLNRGSTVDDFPWLPPDEFLLLS